MYATILREFAVLLFLILEYCDALPGKSCKIPNADAGVCTALEKCDPLYDLNMKMQKTPEEDTFFRQSVGSCNSRGSKIKVCCPPKSQWEKLVVSPVMYPDRPISVVNNIVLETDQNNVDNRLQGSLPDPLTLNVPQPSAQDKLNDWFKEWEKSQPVTEECGVDTNSAQRIVGGNATEIDEYPWLALLEYGPGRYKCGGSLISKSHVVTAAHCLYNPPTKVRLSEYNLTSDPTDVVETNGGGKDYINVTIMEIDWTRLHPDHVYSSSINDIGLIKMTEAVTYGDFIKPICLPAKDYRNTFFTVGTRFTVAGWGSDNEFTNSEVKRSVFVPYVPMDVCAEAIKNISPTQVVCAGGEEGKDSCRGDSGGPLMYEDTDTNYVLVGIVSGGYDQCGAKDHPAVYTYVYNYVDWIKETMANNGNI